MEVKFSIYLNRRVVVMFWCRFRFRRGILKENVVFPVKMAEDLPIVSVHITNTLGIYPLFILPILFVTGFLHM